MLLYLSHADVAGLAVTGTELANAVEAALATSAAGGAVDMPKSTIVLPDGGLYQAMLAAGITAPAPPFAAVKVAGLRPGNAARNLPHIGALIVLLDGASGLPAAIMDARWITAHRTAALSLVAARRLARRDSASIGFVACGAQAEAHFAAFRSEFPLRRVTAYSRTRGSAERLASMARACGLAGMVAAEPSEAVRGHDIVVTSVPADAGLVPFLRADWLVEGSFATLVVLGRSWRPDGFERIGHRVTDARAHAETAGERKLTPSGPYTADLAELISGKAAQRGSASERALLVFQGLALADLAAAAVIYERARQRGVGKGLEA
jgi:ornithine cyclodeaminase/alanine dehydrogenase